MRRYGRRRSNKRAGSRAMVMKGGFLQALLSKLPMIHSTLQTIKPLSFAKDALSKLGIQRPGGKMGVVADVIDKAREFLGYARRRRAGKRRM